MTALLASAEEESRRLAASVSIIDAAELTRGLVRFANAAARLWPTLAAEPEGTVRWNPVVPLRTVADEVRRRTAAGLWPYHGEIDPQLERITTLLGHAARLADSVPSGVPRVDGRTELARIVNLVTHTSRAVLQAEAAAAVDRVRRERLRVVPHANRSDPREPARVRLLADRLDIVEQIASRYVSSRTHPAPPHTLTDQLATALAAWDVQVHRSLATGPTAPTIAKACQIEAFVLTVAVALTAAAAHTDLVDRAGFDRFEQRANAAHQAWTAAAAHWRTLAGAGSLARPDEALLAVAANLRTTATAACADKRRLAPPHTIATRTDLPQLLHDIGTAIAASVETAHVIGGLLVAGNPFTSRRARTPIQGSSPEARTMTVPVSIYRDLIRLAAETTTTARSAAAVLEPLLPRALPTPSAVQAPTMPAGRTPPNTQRPRPAPPRP